MRRNADLPVLFEHGVPSMKSYPRVMIKVNHTNRLFVP